MNKKGFAIPGILILALLVVGGLIVFGVIDVGLSAAPARPGAPTAAVAERPTSCPDDGDTSVYFQGINTEDTSGTADYQNVNISIWNVKTPTIVMNAESTATSALSTALTVDCGETYKYVVVVDSDEHNRTGMMAEPGSFTTMDGREDLTIDVSDSASILIQAYDEEGRAFVYSATHAQGDNSTAEFTVAANGTSGVRYASTSTTTHGDGNTALGNNDKFEWCYTVRTAASGDTWHGADDYVLIDMDSSDYNQDPLITFNGKPLSKSSKSVLADEDQGYVSAYELIYRLDQYGEYISSQSKKLCLYATTKASGTVDADIVLLLASTAWKNKDTGDGVEKRLYDSGGVAQYREFITITNDIS